MNTLMPLHDIESLDAAIAESRDRPVLLFKHSRHCGVSSEALDELHAHIERRNGGGTAYKIITVQSARAVSNAAAERLALRHETPQAILLRDGKVAWSASHFRVTAQQLDRAIDARRG